MVAQVNDVDHRASHSQRHNHVVERAERITDMLHDCPRYYEIKRTIVTKERLCGRSCAVMAIDSDEILFAIGLTKPSCKLRFATNQSSIDFCVLTLIALGIEPVHEVH